MIDGSTLFEDLTMLILYIAMSLDGYIARKDGSVDWLVDSAAADADSRQFYGTIDGLLMGRRTYDQGLTFGEWPYPGKPTYVFTHHPPEQHPEGVQFISGSPEDALALMDRGHVQRIWLVGGTEIALPFLRQPLIEEYVIFLMPLLLGDGIPLLPAGIPEQGVDLISGGTIGDGIVKLEYKRK